MLNGTLLVWSIVLLVGLVLGGWSFLHSRESSVERRRRKSHNRLVAKTNRPMVKFSVRTPKKK